MTFGGLRAWMVFLAAAVLGCASGTGQSDRDAMVGSRDAARSDGGGASSSACGACSTPADCSPDERCVPMVAGGRTCLPACEVGGAACPERFTCSTPASGGDAVCTPPERRCCIDADGDEYGIGMDCGMLDCDDGEGAIHPDATELCNGVDDDCDGDVDEPSDERCDDGSDQDCDQLVDCADTASCGEGATCGPHGQTCTGGACTCAGGSTESECGDGNDDDCDGMLDCADPDCGGLACDATGRTCIAGACTCGSGGGPELCNGIDDDCDGAIDRSCPDALGLCCAVAGARFGGTDGSDYSIACPAGSVIMGFDGRASTSRYEVAQPICAAIMMAREVATPEQRYSLRLGGVTVAAATSGSGGTPFSDRCSGNEVVIGIEGRSGAEIDQLAFQCARVTVERGEAGAWGIVITPTTTTIARGGTGGGPLSYRCPEGRVATGIEGRASDRMKSIALVCSELTLAAL